MRAHSALHHPTTAHPQVADRRHGTQPMTLVLAALTHMPMRLQKEPKNPEHQLKLTPVTGHKH
jgi:hypothetical protein